MKWCAPLHSRFSACVLPICISLPISVLLSGLVFLYYSADPGSAFLDLDRDFSPLLSSEYEADDTLLLSPRAADCDIFDGQWVFDDAYPLYDSCAFAERDFQCHRNGRPDTTYQKWRWQPHHCDIPRFDGRDMLERLRGMRVVFVGDSMSRTQWESLSCLLLQAVEDKASVKLVGGPITKLAPHLGARFLDHNVSVDYRRSPFLVVEGKDLPRRSPKRVHSILKLEKMDMDVARTLIDADVVVVNTGHWWTQAKTYRNGVYFNSKDKLLLGMSIFEAYRKAVTTITTWVNDNINFNRTEVFFRSYEPSHTELSMATLPYANVSDVNIDGFPRARILEDAIEQTGSSAAVLKVTSISALRPDGHVFNWTVHNRVLDHAHWCLPGVPDTWNELLYASLLLKGRGVWGAKQLE